MALSGTAVRALVCGIGLAVLMVGAQADDPGRVIYRPSGPGGDINEAAGTIVRLARYQRNVTALYVGTPSVPLFTNPAMQAKVDPGGIILEMDGGSDRVLIALPALDDIRVLQDTVMTIPWYGVAVNAKHVLWTSVAEKNERLQSRANAIALAEAIYTLHAKIPALNACVQELAKQTEFEPLGKSVELGGLTGRAELLALTTKPTEPEKPLLGKWVQARRGCLQSTKKWFDKFKPDFFPLADESMARSHSLAAELIGGKMTYGEFQKGRIDIGTAQAKSAAEILIRQQRNFEEAKQYYDYAIGLASWWTEGYYLRGLLFGETKSYDKAVSDVTEYLKREPQGEHAAAARAKLASWQEQTLPDDVRFERVARAYREAQPRPAYPESARRLKVQAEAAVREKDFKDAAKLYQEALEIVPWWSEGRYNRALIMGELKDFAEATTEMRRFLILSPESPEARAAQDKIYEWERRVRK
jgi:tetratricopeptide (TPR) repeat protein